VKARDVVWIFCRVVDNFGDAGVCWRLARQLVVDHDMAVTLFIDSPETLKQIAPAEPLLASGSTAPLRTVPWTDHDETGMLAQAHPHPQAVVSGFGCALPPGVRARLAARGPTDPVWVDLEYLSAEDWVDDFHGRASPKPSDNALAHYFFPGFTPATGGLLREQDLDTRLIDFQSSGEATRFLASLGIINPQPSTKRRTRISLFCYRDAPLKAWLQALIAADEPTQVLATAPVAAAAFSAVGAPEQPRVWTDGAVEIQRLPMLSQDDYDRLLWSCDLNIVRGEDSWIRAHWAARPFIWQPYPQADHAHLNKLDAWLARMAETLGGDAAASVARVGTMMRAWSTGEHVSEAWHNYQRDSEAISGLHERWRLHLLAQTDLASRLVAFIRDRLR